MLMVNTEVNTEEFNVLKDKFPDDGFLYLSIEKLGSYYDAKKTFEEVISYALEFGQHHILLRDPLLLVVVVAAKSRYGGIYFFDETGLVKL